MEAVGHPIQDELKLLFNVDGIRISNSSLSEFWPIRFKVLGKLFEKLTLKNEINKLIIVTFLEWNDVLEPG